MILQFDVVRNPIGAGRTLRPFLVNVQHELFSSSLRRVLVPLVTFGTITPIPRLNPVLSVFGREFFLQPDEPLTLGLRHLGKAVANLEADRERIIAALDLVFTGI